MPGEIGASMFSPRPARGYRFHSLQVEIIIVLSRHQGRNRLHQTVPSEAAFVLRSERLIAISAPAKSDSGLS
jgi:hypothetical protein